MKAPQPMQVRLEAYPDAPDWFVDFAKQLNSHTDDVRGALSKRLTLGDNLAGDLAERTFTTGASVDADAPPFPLLITPSFEGKPRQLQVVDIEDLDTGAAFTTPVFATWQWDGERVSVRFLTGLSASTRYRVVLRLEP